MRLNTHECVTDSGLGTFPYLCVRLRTFAYVCVPLRIFAYLCVPVRTFAYLCVNFRVGFQLKSWGPQRNPTLKHASRGVIWGHFRSLRVTSGSTTVWDLFFGFLGQFSLCGAPCWFDTHSIQNQSCHTKTSLDCIVEWILHGLDIPVCFKIPTKTYAKVRKPKLNFTSQFWNSLLNHGYSPKRCLWTNGWMWIVQDE